MNGKSIALFGGTFDPIHLGHTAVVDAARARIDADKVIFIPAKRSPLKALYPEAGDEDRLEMIVLAISENANELKEQGPSYTLETVKHFQNCLGEESFIYWLLGADSIADLPHWHGITELIDRCNLAVMHRAGFEPPDFSKFQPILGADRVEKLRRNVIETPLIDISSTQVRKRLAAGRDVSDMVCPKVLQYIRERHLYGVHSD